MWIFAAACHGVHKTSAYVNRFGDALMQFSSQGPLSRCYLSKRKHSRQGIGIFNDVFHTCFPGFGKETLCAYHHGSVAKTVWSLQAADGFYSHLILPPHLIGIIQDPESADKIKASLFFYSSDAPQNYLIFFSTCRYSDSGYLARNIFLEGEKNEDTSFNSTSARKRRLFRSIRSCMENCLSSMPHISSKIQWVLPAVWNIVFSSHNRMCAFSRHRFSSFHFEF